MASKDLDLIRGLSANHNRRLFVDASCTVFRVESLVSIVVAGQDDILGSRELMRDPLFLL